MEDTESGQLKLSKVFYIDPKTLPIPKPEPHLTPDPYPFTDLRNSILRNGFDSNYPIIVRMNELLILRIKGMRYRIGKIDDRPCFASQNNNNQSFNNNDQSYIMDGNHRLVIALELKLKKIPVRFILN